MVERPIVICILSEGEVCDEGCPMFKNCWENLNKQEKNLKKGNLDYITILATGLPVVHYSLS